MKKDKVSLTSQHTNPKKHEPEQESMPKSRSWNYKDIEEYRKYFDNQKATTQKKNARKLLQYCEWAKEEIKRQNEENHIPEDQIKLKATPEEIIKLYKETKDRKEWQRDRFKEIQTFYTYLIEKKKYAINTARNIPSGILKFYTLYCDTILEVTKAFDGVQIADNEFILTKEDLRKVYYYADLEGQTLLSLAVCLGYASIDFLHLNTKKLKNLVEEAEDKNLEFIQFIGKTRQKSKIQPRSHLTPEAIHCLSDYLKVLEKKHKKLPKYLFEFTNQGLNKKIRSYFEKANIKLYDKSLTFHLFRKYLYTMLQKYNPDIAKVICAHSVSLSDITYIQDLNAECFRVFKESYKLFALNGSLTGKKSKEQAERIKALEEALQAVETENSISKTRVEQLAKTVLTLDEGNIKLQKLLEDLQKAHFKQAEDFAQTFEKFGKDTTQKINEMSKEHQETLKELLEQIEGLDFESMQKDYDLLAEEVKHLREDLKKKRE